MNAVQLFILLCTFTAVCQADDDISVSCGDVTGSVGKQVNLTCSIFHQRTGCCIVMCKFQYPGIYNNSICAQELPYDPCEQSKSFSCSYTPTTAKKERIVLFVQTMCGVKRTEFTVDTTGIIKPAIVTSAPVKKDISVSCDDVTGSVGKEVTFTCSVSQQITECCITNYKFQYPEIYNDSAICRRELPVNSCDQRNNFSCSFTPTTAKKERIVFFVQTVCGAKRTGFTVDISGTADISDISVSCDDVTGSVGKEVTFTCSVSQQITECCITNYKFQYPEIYNDSAICRRELPVNSCDQRNNFLCSFTPTTAMTEQFRFFVQTQCGSSTSEFTVDIPDISVSCDDVTGSVGKEVTFTCSVSQQITECCITNYKFQYPEIYNDSAICRRELPVNSCEQSKNFTCSFTPTTAMTEQFRFFVQTQCGRSTSEFTVDIPDKFQWTVSRTSQQETAEGGLSFKGCLKAPV